MLRARGHPLWALLLLALTGCRANRSPDRFHTPPDFTVETAARPEDTGSIVAFTFDARGRPVVAPEGKHPVLLLDEDGDGVFETRKTVSTRVNTLQGLWYDGPALYAVGNNEDGEAGLYRLATAGNGDAGEVELLARFEKRMGEHGPHDIRRGPDGFPTVLLGNNTAIPTGRIDPASPLRGLEEWQLLDRYMDFTGRATGLMAPGGVLARWNEDRRDFTILAGGLRNAYNHAYHADGEAFTFDSDSESDLDMPWYRPIRTVHAVPGGDYGWRSGSGAFPEYFYDTLPPVRELGRGSPVGVEFYQHRAFPPDFRDAFLQADWSRGRILVAKLTRAGATYKDAAPRPAELISGEPLNVTDIEVGPDGCVYFSTGGRNTEGGLYRIRYTPGWWASLRRRILEPSPPEGILEVVRQPQPLSSWGHAALERKRDQMGARWGEELEKLARTASADPADRVQALFLLQRFGPRPAATLLRPLSQDPDPRVRAAAVYVVGLHGSPRAKAIAAAAFRDPDPFVRRRAAEAAVRMGLSPDSPSFVPVDDIYALLRDADRFVRYAGRLALERAPREDWRHRVLAETSPVAALEGMLALIRTRDPAEDLEPVFERLLLLLGRQDLPVPERLAALRLFAIAAAEAGVRPTLRKQFSDLLLPRFPDPAGNEALNREMARVLAYCGQPEAVAEIFRAMPSGEENPALQIHYVYCLRTMRDGWTADSRRELIRWFQKAAQWRGGAGFTGYLNLMFESALELFPDEEKKAARARLPEFAPASAGPVRIPRARGTRSIRAQEIFAYQMFDPMTLLARPEQGRELFEKEGASCHRFGSLGKDFGPDLTSIRSRFRKADILEALLWPSKTVSDQFQGIIVETTDGDAVNGLLLREDNHRLLLKTAETPQPVEIPKRKIRTRRKSDISIMPEGILDPYDQASISNLIAFLLARPPE